MPDRARLAVVDYGMGNLYSVQLACERVGCDAVITSSPEEVRAADAIVLPGVGAFGDAMSMLRAAGLADAITHVASSGRPILGVCLGLQLFMSESFEFGRHEGLGLLEGSVLPFEVMQTPRGLLKIPHVGWNAIHQPRASAWEGTSLDGVTDGTFMYFVHSYYVVPRDPAGILATTTYGDVKFCSALRRENVFGCQFHPERSGPAGLRVYMNLVTALLGAA